MAKPGMVNLPDFFTSLAATAAKLSSTFLTADPFNSVAVASSLTIADLDIATTPLIAVVFIASAFALGAIVRWQGRAVHNYVEALSQDG